MHLYDAGPGPLFCRCKQEPLLRSWPAVQAAWASPILNPEHIMMSSPQLKRTSTSPGTRQASFVACPWARFVPLSPRNAASLFRCRHRCRSSRRPAAPPALRRTAAAAAAAAATATSKAHFDRNDAVGCSSCEGVLLNALRDVWGGLGGRRVNEFERRGELLPELLPLPQSSPMPPQLVPCLLTPSRPDVEGRGKAASPSAACAALRAALDECCPVRDATACTVATTGTPPCCRALPGRTLGDNNPLPLVLSVVAPLPAVLSPDHCRLALAGRLPEPLPQPTGRGTPMRLLLPSPPRMVGCQCCACRPSDSAASERYIASTPPRPSLCSTYDSSALRAGPGE
eukprot:365052-Chlamydomonas_euryale.AAC.19